MNNEKLTPQDLSEKEEYSLIAEVEHKDFKSFILNEVKKMPQLIKFYSAVQMIAGIMIVFMLGARVFDLLKTGKFNIELGVMLGGILFSLTILVVFHELIHAVAFLLLGKTNINFGAQIKKFMFYVQVDKQVLNRSQMKFVAFAPLYAITTIGVLVSLYNWGSSISLFSITLVLMHLFFCGGDLIIVSFLDRFAPNEVYTYDDKKLKKSFYYIKKSPFDNQTG